MDSIKDETEKLRNNPKSKEISDIDCDFSHTSFFNIKLYTFILCLINVFGSAGTAIIMGTVTTLQKAFHLNSSQMGIIQAAYSFGYSGSILFVGHFASNKPRWVSTGTIFVALSCFLPLICHFVIWAPDTLKKQNFLANFSQNDNLCHGSPLTSLPAHSCDEASSDPESNFPIGFLIFVTASLCSGFGFSPLNTVALTFIDDNVPKKESAFYMGLTMSMYAVGPVIGLFFHAYVMQFDAVTLDKKESVDFGFVGAWWISYLIVGSFLFLLALLLLLFPKHLQLNKASDETRSVFLQKEKLERPNFLIKFLGAIFDLLSNPIYLTTLVGSSLFSGGMTGLFYFFPKIIENQFGVSSTISNICFGIVEIPVGIGMVLGGWLIKRFDFSIRGAALFTPLLQMFGVIAIGIILFIQCSPSYWPGITDSLETDLGEVLNFTLECNSACNCDISGDKFSPVCGADGQNFLTPCHAGCSSFDNKSVYSNCSCIEDKWPQTAEVGSCLSIPAKDSFFPNFLPCPLLLVYMAIFLIAMLAFFLTRLTVVNVCIRVVKDENKGLALGLRSFCGNIMGNVVSTVIIGKIMDSACLIWHSDLQNQLTLSVNSCLNVIQPKTGNCMVYASSRFHWMTHSFSGSLDLLGIFSFFVAYWCTRRSPSIQNGQAVEKNDNAVAS